MPTLERAGRTLHYLDVGRGPAVLLLHAFPLSAAMFAPQMEALAERYRILAPDVPGFGQSDGGGMATEMTLLAEDARALLEHAGVSRAVVGGVSMGGYATLALLGRGGDLLQGIILADTHPHADDEAGKARRQQTARDVLENGPAAFAESMSRRLVSPAASEALVAQVRGMILQNSPAAIAAASLGMAHRPDTRAALGAYRGPALVIFGEADDFAPRPRQEEMAQLVPGARLRMIPRAGHLSNLEAPAEFNAALDEFLSYCWQTT
jgi:pimeloyl-ACP methyl ester carboxylesterase